MVPLVYYSRSKRMMHKNFYAFFDLFGYYIIYLLTEAKMSTIYIKPNDGLARKVFLEIEHKKKKFRIKNAIAGLIEDILSSHKSPLEIDGDFNDTAEMLEIAPADLRRVGASAVMAIRNSLKVDLNIPDGLSNRSSVFVAIDGRSLAKWFSSFASGQLKKFIDKGNKCQYLEDLYYPRFEMNTIRYEVDWQEVDGKLSCKVKAFPFTEHESWFIDLLCSLDSGIEKIINQKVQ